MSKYQIRKNICLICGPGRGKRWTLTDPDGWVVGCWASWRMAVGHLRSRINEPQR